MNPDNIIFRVFVLLLMLFFEGFAFANGGNCMQDKSTVAIIGAGAAGLTAGYYLHREGIPIAIFDSNSRIGGRAQTYYFSQNKFEELGGKEITDGGNAKNIRALAAEVGSSIRSEPEEYIVRTLDSSGNIKSLFDVLDIPKDMGEKSTKFKSLSDRLDHYLGSESLQRKLVETWISCYEGVNTQYISDHTGREHISWLMKRVEMGKLEGQQLRESEYFSMGASDFIMKVSSSLGDKICTEHKLVSIDELNDGVRLHFENGRMVECCAVILAVPIEVLGKIKILSGFEGASLKFKSEIVKGGKNSKVLIPISTPLNVPQFALSPRFTLWWNTARNVLTVYFGGNEALLPLDCGSYQSFKELLWSEIIQLYPELKTEKVNFDGWKIMDWSLEEHVGCSYSHVVMGREDTYGEIANIYGEKVRLVFHPIQNKIFFAGEHTAVENPATLEGAVTSGKLAAQMIIRSLGKHDKVANM